MMYGTGECICHWCLVEQLKYVFSGNDRQGVSVKKDGCLGIHSEIHLWLVCIVTAQMSHIVFTGRLDAACKQARA